MHVPAPRTRFAYAGCFTSAARRARGRGVVLFERPEAGAWRQLEIFDDLFNPSYLIVHPEKPILYAAHGDADYASAFAADPATGRLRALGQAATGGQNGVHLAVDPAARHLLLANYGTGTVAVLPIAETGALQPASQLVPLPGAPGPHRREQTASHPHQIVFDPSGRYVLIPDKGLDRIFIAGFAGGRLELTAETAMRPGAGPRHLVFHPNGTLVFVLNELDSTIATCAWNAASAQLTPLDIVSTLPRDFISASTAAGIAITPDGSHLFASNRGHDSIFSAALGAERLHPTAWTDSQGRDPRFITLAPAGDQLLVANEQGDNIVGFNIDRQTGALTANGYLIETPSVSTIAFL